MAGFERFDAFEAFGLARKIKKSSFGPFRKTWLASSPDIGSSKIPFGRFLTGSRGLKGLEGASGSFGPAEKERLGLPQPLIFHENSPETEPLGLPQLNDFSEMSVPAALTQLRKLTNVASSLCLAS